MCISWNIKERQFILTATVYDVSLLPLHTHLLGHQHQIPIIIHVPLYKVRHSFLHLQKEVLTNLTSCLLVDHGHDVCQLLRPTVHSHCTMVLIYAYGLVLFVAIRG